MQTAEEIIRFIAESKKKTPVKVYLRGQLEHIQFPASVRPFVDGKAGVVFGEWSDIAALLEANREVIEDFEIEADRRNSAIPLLDTKDIPARIEPGAIIRDKVKIGENAVIMMGAILNIGAEVGPGTMIDMGAILGGRATVGANCHIGAGAVLAGVIEPPSAQPVIVEDGVLIGANAVVLEGVRIGKGSVVAAGAVVIEDVAPGTVVAGVPARVIKRIEDVDSKKIELKEELRRL
ncbi:2,3,4,5-tetrahydropyridine-2,6-dicarboxylate N-ac etyltransferase [Alicyclobacillus hesperidum URH17-3-68]|uniref:2,3,4,5-tetrahydropyridine-2,6-dicarboxylate N-acetyltransferase n=1 Tax=Alicyclobacillus hesperidum TaxID=89784 RepID=UPI000281C0F9|nr:2,3,4,5-tetrahydropyridine-2,6-dicarboxylate N-acetyltransferase [Alicyclobacillus hesperidum]EJY56679.1 2,3,4,5-tetrahydropyridine-2,6-dicarboxylate N-ac etyltransferase [Alicyclobacillus hesperidum URH17-3-68]KRW92150.1 2,3,4,5-tetrahydropyridine-2,6-carboxylate N-succinyltransferase [Alicyclobacillus tengchongensis]GLG01961.1 2,3,4,5-tetrahydropyridine-2,6-dicarboxylate N-acetyltransferase [Alicyclobacillus hesperidum subsp. aegles]